ncbi:MAG: hypothetical protein GY932_07785 [Arcobacter sp.]|nr:hypothetical protein [Arcobacter sp.]
MKNIKYTVRNDLTQKQMDTLLDDSKTINLTNKVSSKQAYISRQARLDRNE